MAIANGGYMFTYRYGILVMCALLIVGVNAAPPKDGRAAKIVALKPPMPVGPSVASARRDGASSPAAAQAAAAFMAVGACANGNGQLTFTVRYDDNGDPYIVKPDQDDQSDG